MIQINGRRSTATAEVDGEEEQEEEAKEERRETQSERQGPRGLRRLQVQIQYLHRKVSLLADIRLRQQRRVAAEREKMEIWCGCRCSSSRCSLCHSSLEQSESQERVRVSLRLICRVEHFLTDMQEQERGLLS